MTVDDSHAKLAAEMRAWDWNTRGSIAKPPEWAARVEQLGARRCLCGGPMKCEKCGERWFMPGQMNRTIDEAREAEIATVREEIIAKAGPEPSPGTVQLRIRGDAMRATKDDLLAWAARLGGTTT